MREYLRSGLGGGVDNRLINFLMFIWAMEFSALMQDQFHHPFGLICLLLLAALVETGRSGDDRGLSRRDVEVRQTTHDHHLAKNTSAPGYKC